MFDSSEIAKRALLRAGTLKAARSLRRKRIAASLGACLTLTLIVITTALSSPSAVIEDGRVPLSGELPPQDVPAYSVPAYDTVTVPAGSRDTGMTLNNPGDNPYYLSFEIILKDSGETLYLSDMIAPSMSAGEVALSRDLPEGSYKAVLLIRAFEPDGLAGRNGASAEFDLVIV